MSLRTENISLVLGDGDQQIRALDDVSVEVSPGELLVVVGPSGAGKSSLLAVCGALRTPTDGKVFIDGQEITGLPPAKLTEIRRQRIGFVFQQSNLVPSLSALDQLMLLVDMRGGKRNGQVREKALSLLDEVGMSQRRDRRPGQLSGGERQRVGIARALMADPAILLVDEPTSMLDHNRGKQIVDVLQRACHEHNVATMMVTHDRGVLEKADRVARIRDGKLTVTAAGAESPD